MKLNLNAYLKLFKVFGINICNRNGNHLERFTAPVIRNAMKFYWLCAYVVVLSSTYLDIVLNKNKNFKKLLVILFLLTDAFLLWYYVVKFRAKISKNIIKLQNLLRVLEITPPKKIIFITWLLFSVICIVSGASHEYDYSVEESEIILRVFTFNAVRSLNENYRYLSLMIWHTYGFLLNFGHFLIYYFALFYIIICLYMTMLLSRHIEINKRILKFSFVTSVDCDACFIRYHSIIMTLKEINLKLAFPAFLESGFHAGTVLYAALNVFKNHYSATDISMFVVNFALFTGITFAASSVNQTDKLAKESNLEVLRSLSRKDRKKTKESVEILSDICHAPAFALSGWNLFDYTTRFYLTAIGCLITYSLLIIKL